MNLRKDNCKVSFIYQYPAEQRLNHTTIVDQSATKSEKGGVATIRRWLLSLGKKETESFIDVSFDDLSNIRKWIYKSFAYII